MTWGCKISLKTCGEKGSTKSLQLPVRRIPFRIYIALTVLVVLSFVVKAPIWQLDPQVFSDSPGYVVPAVNLLSGRGYGVQENGFRSPTYPLFLAVILLPLDRAQLARCQDAHRPTCIDNAAKSASGQFALRAIVVAQIFLGILTTALLFALGLRLTRNTLIAFLFGSGYALNLSTAFWEISILTETLTTFLLTLAVFLVIGVDVTRRLTTLALGIVLAALALCHQLFLGFWILPAAYLFFRARDGGLVGRLSHAAMPLVVPLIFVGAWSAYNYAVNGVFTPSTLSGFVLIQMVAPVVQNAPEGYDGITQPYVGYRDAMIAETGSHSGAIFRAWPAMMGWTGLTWSQISAKLTTLSFYLIYHYPQTYIQDVAEAWTRFWDFQIYHYDPIPSAVPGWAVWLTSAVTQAFANVFFGFSALIAAILFTASRRRPRLFRPVPFGEVLFMIATVLFAAVISSLTNFQDNARLRTYVLPLEYGSIALVLWAAWRMLVDMSEHRTRNAN